MEFQNDKVFVFDNFLAKKLCEHYLRCIKDIGPQPDCLPFEQRTQNITKDPIGPIVRDFLNDKFNLNIEIDQVQTQNWHVNSYGPLHKHDHNGREKNKYNSLIYLNDDFEGGEFITDIGFKLKPKQGTLTFFNGQTIKHGTSKVFLKDRKTLIFWWKEV
tara:strand:- start:142 stop:618 length:477 start_codon:yes stop_codon:yes gene_type:complete